jgi:hypothetical protein
VTGPSTLTPALQPVRRRSRRRRSLRRRSPLRRWSVRGVVLLVVLAVLPVPWLHHVDEDPPGFAWRLSGRLHVEGRTVDPPGRWSWLTVGRPPLLGELAWGWLHGDPPGRDLRQGSASNRPEFSDPSAAAVGLNAAGAELPMTVIVEASGATQPDVPDPVVITRINGIDLTDRASYERGLARGARSTWFRDEDDGLHRVNGPDLPYVRVRVVDVAPPGLEARIGSDHPVLRWWRSLSTGSSHGVIVALAVYADASGEDLARGRHIAGTGRIAGDGTVGPIGGLQAKATAARRAGADVLVFPATQAAELADFDPRSMRLLGVSSLAEAIAALAADDLGS